MESLIKDFFLGLLNNHAVRKKYKTRYVNNIENHASQMETYFRNSRGKFECSIQINYEI